MAAEVGTTTPPDRRASGRVRRPWSGTPLPIPAWAIAIVGGALAAPLGGLWPPEQAPAAMAVLAPTLHGTACGALGAIALGRFRRRIVVLGGAIGAAAGALFLGAGLGLEPLVIPGYVLLAALPALVVSRGLRLGLGQTVPLCAVSVLLVSLALPFYAAFLFLTRYVLTLPADVVQGALACVAGALAWARPASVRLGGRWGV